jgi:hypothetical protein
LKEFLFKVGTLVVLEKLNFGGFKTLKTSPRGLGVLTILKELDVEECEVLEERPSRVCTLVALEELNFVGCKSLKTITGGLGGLTSLNEIHMKKCEALESFP